MRACFLKKPVSIGENGTLRLIGHVRRHVAYSRKEIYDYDFAQYCNRVGFPISGVYGIARGSLETGLKGFLKYDRVEPEYDAHNSYLAEKMLTSSFAVYVRRGLLGII